MVVLYISSLSILYFVKEMDLNTLVILFYIINFILYNPFYFI